MAKKHWIYIKRGLSEDPKHREAMGNRIWLYMHIIDRADWETGIVYDWRDPDEAQDMSLPWRTLQKQRQELEELGYISCEKKQHCLNIKIVNWVNPKDYSGKIMNKRSSTQNSVLCESTQNSVLSNSQSTPQSTQQPYARLGTPTSHSNINDQGWMDEDPICLFLKALPGFNPTAIEATRREIVSHHYDVEELPYLWEECADGDNPIGLFTYKVSNGQHSVDWQMLQMQQQGEAVRQAANKAFQERIEEARQREAQKPTKIEADASVTDKHLMIWQHFISEMSFDVTPQTYKTYLQSARPVSVNGTWKIAVPSVEWWQKRMLTSLNRIAKGVTGKAIEFEFIQDGAK